MVIRTHLNERGVAKNVFSYLFSAGLFLLVGLALLNKQAVADYLKLRNYTAPAEIAQLATDSTMNDQARRVFYVNQPVVHDKAAFKIDCPNNGGEMTIVLGCYHGGQNGIYLLQVTDERLDGVKQVTAAHELLHAAYDRLSSAERRKVDAMLTAYFTNELKDERIKTTIEGYKKTEPNDLVNEMHSIFATEIRTLPAELENYYKQYFTNRAQIVGFADQYQAEFTSRQSAIEQFDTQLAALKQQIADSEAGLSNLQTEITSAEQNLQNLRRRDDIAAFNAGVPGYNAKIDAYNRLVKQIQGLVAQFNQQVEERNSLASEIAELSNALNTNVEQIKQ